MKIAKALRQTAETAARALAVLISALFLAGPVQLCLCDEDPDHCGHECHDCSAPQSDECNHLSIEFDDFTLPPKDTVAVFAPIAAPKYEFFSLPDFEIKISPHPSAASPPMRRDQYLSYSPSLNPLS